MLSGVVGGGPKIVVLNKIVVYARNFGKLYEAS